MFRYCTAILKEFYNNGILAKHVNPLTPNDTYSGRTAPLNL